MDGPSVVLNPFKVNIHDECTPPSGKLKKRSPARVNLKSELEVGLTKTFLFLWVHITDSKPAQREVHF